MIGNAMTHANDTGHAAFPPKILELLHEVADRRGTEFHGPWEDANGDPLQDDADAAIAWIKAHSAQPKGLSPT